MGIDPSVSATGIVILAANKTKHPDLVLEKEIKFPKLKGMERAKAICTEVMTIIHDHGPQTIVVEGYSLNMKNASSVIPLVELGGILRLMMHLDGFKWYDPRATELKKFVTGGGAAQKSAMMMHVLHRWGYMAKTDNLADAYGLACIGLSITNRLPGLNLPQRTVVSQLEIRSG